MTITRRSKGEVDRMWEQAHETPRHLPECGKHSCHPGCPAERPPAQAWADLKRDYADRKRDLGLLAEAFAELYLQALNGVACDPGQKPCESCAWAWKQGREVLDKHDPKWGNLHRGGSHFQPREWDW
jgi:hypothetical protein